MSITRESLIQLFVDAGTPAGVFSLFGGFRLADNVYETCSREFVQASYEDLLDILPVECVTTRNVGGGKTVRVMRHTMADGDLQNEAGDCDTHGHVFMAHCVVGNWVKALRTKTRRGGLALGVIDYVAIAKAGDGRAGGHDRNWFIDHDHKLNWFEPGDNAFPVMLREEVESITYGRAV